MIKHEEARKVLNKYRNNYYNSPIEEERAVALALDIFLPQQEKKDELLELYREKEKLAHNPYNNTTNDIRPFYEWACELSSLETKIQALEEKIK